MSVTIPGTAPTEPLRAWYDDEPLVSDVAFYDIASQGATTLMSVLIGRQLATTIVSNLTGPLSVAQDLDGVLEADPVRQALRTGREHGHLWGSDDRDHAAPGGSARTRGVHGQLRHAPHCVHGVTPDCRWTRRRRMRSPGTPEMGAAAGRPLAGGRR